MRYFYLKSIFLLSNFLSNGQSITDTLTINPNSLIFYSITQTEFDTLSTKDPDRGLNEVISDFEYYVGKLLPFLKKDTSLYVIYTAHRYYGIVNESGIAIFDRVEPRNVVGIIMNSASKHEISKGIGTDVDMMQTIKDFFQSE